MQDAIIEVDIHGMTRRQAKVFIDAWLRRAGDAYRLRVVHGYRGGTELKDMIRKEYGRNHPQVRRLEYSLNPGETDLVLREF